jgi:hypothetical protein
LGDTPLITKAAEVTAISDVILDFHFHRPGRYRLKGEIKKGATGTTGSFDLRFGLATYINAGGVIADALGGASSSSTTYSSFSIDLPFLPGHCYMAIRGGSTQIYLRNVSLCGIVGYDDLDVLS